MKRHCFTICLLLSINFYAQGESPMNKLEVETIIAFYNLENLFHPSDDPQKFDDDRTPDGAD